ncbi:ribonuclease I [Klebsiella pneumoniae]|uniref:Ribonuclease I n=1 Tax=Klebsiella pneumoniae TaxID=573 RepID=A0A377WEM6_KLEPN|nr:ribonuclease I [Klebsiella pneumoniae]
MFRKDFAAIALVLTATQAVLNRSPPTPDTLILTATSLPSPGKTGFCQSMYDRNRNEPEECRLQQDTANKADFLTVHGPVARAAKVHCRARSG